MLFLALHLLPALGAMATLAWPCGVFAENHAHGERGHGTQHATLIRIAL